MKSMNEDLDQVSNLASAGSISNQQSAKPDLRQIQTQTISNTRRLGACVSVFTAGLMFVCAASALADEDQVTVTVAGITIPNGDGGQATLAVVAPGFNNSAICGGYLYFPEANSHRVRKINISSGFISTLAGNGALGFSGDGGPATVAQLNSPPAVACDSTNNVYIVDQGNNRIRKVDALTGVITTVVGGGPISATGENLLATAAALNTPTAVVIDSNNNIYVAETGSPRVRKVDGPTGANPGNISTISTGAVTARGLLVEEVGAARNLFMAESTRISKLNLLGSLPAAPTVLAGTAGAYVPGAYPLGEEGAPASAAHLADPRSMALDAEGSLYVSETAGHRVRKITATPGFALTSSNLVTTIAGARTFPPTAGGSDASQTPASSALLSRPTGLAFDPAGNLYIGDLNNGRVRKVTKDPGHSIKGSETLSNYAGGGPVPPLGDGGPATSARVTGPRATATDAEGNLYIASDLAHRIRKVDTATGAITTVVGNGTAGSTNGSSATSGTTINGVYDVAFDKAGNLYVVENAGARVRKVTARCVDGGPQPCDSQGAYPIDGSESISTYAGGGTLGTCSGCAALSATLSGPEAIAFDSSDNLYITDRGANRVRRVDASGDNAGKIFTVAGTGLAAGPGLPGPGDGGLATAALLNFPVGIAFDATVPVANYYVTETQGHRIRKVNSAGTISTIAGIGFGGFSGDGYPATAAAIQGPSGINFDSAGDLFFADATNGRVRRIDAAGDISTVAGTLTGGFNGAGILATDTKLNRPYDIIFDAAGNPFVSDLGNNRVRRLDVKVGLSPGLDTSGLYLTATIELPATRNASDVDLNSIVLKAVNDCGEVRTVGGSLTCEAAPGSGPVLQVGRAPGTPADAVGQILTVQFDQATVASWKTSPTQNLRLRVDGTFNVAGTSIGRHFSSTNLINPDPNAGTVQSSLSETQELHAVTSQQLGITNLSLPNHIGDDLHYAISVAAGSCTAAPGFVPWLSVLNPTGAIATDVLGLATVVFDSTYIGVGTYTATLCVRTDDIDRPLISIPVTLKVNYHFAGFFAPVNMGMLNTANSGQAIPLKFTVTDAFGVPVTNLTMPPVSFSVAPISCNTYGGLLTAPIEVYASEASGLQNHGFGNYQFNWKTAKGLAGCQRLFLNLSDTVYQSVDFQFR